MIVNKNENTRSEQREWAHVLCFFHSNCPIIKWPYLTNHPGYEHVYERGKNDTFVRNNFCKHSYERGKMSVTATNMCVHSDNMHPL